MMERCIIVGAGDFFGMPMETSTDDSISKPMEKTTEDSTRKPMEKRPCDLLIAADAGYENLKKLASGRTSLSATSIPCESAV